MVIFAITLQPVPGDLYPITHIFLEFFMQIKHAVRRGTQTCTEDAMLLCSWARTLRRSASQWHAHRVWRDMTNQQDCAEKPFGTLWLVLLKGKWKRAILAIKWNALTRQRKRKGPECLKLWPHNGPFFRAVHFSDSNSITIMGRGF